MSQRARECEAQVDCATGPSNYMDAAFCFYKALSVYPEPVELLNIYQRTQPPEVHQYVLLCVSVSAQARGMGSMGVEVRSPLLLLQRV